MKKEWSEDTQNDHVHNIKARGDMRWDGTRNMRKTCVNVRKKICTKYVQMSETPNLGHVVNIITPQT